MAKKPSAYIEQERRGRGRRPSGRDSIYAGDTEFRDYDSKSSAKWAEISQKQAKADALKQNIEALTASPPLFFTKHDRDKGKRDLAQMKEDFVSLMKEVEKLSGEAQIFEIQRENRGATLKQAGVNTQAAAAGEKSVKAENLLSQNIQQEIQGRISRNNQQAAEAATGVGLVASQRAGRAIAQAGQAGYGAGSGTGNLLSRMAADRANEDRAAIEEYRVGRQNLLMGQGEAAAKAAESLTGTVKTTTADWGVKSTAAVTGVTGTLLKNAEQYAGLEGFSGDVYYAGSGVAPSAEAVDTTLATWSFDAYLSALNTLTGRSANRSTWDQMLLEQKGKPVNPYEQYTAAISPLTPLAGTSSNLLAAAATMPDVYTSTLSGNKRTGSLL